jgi:hypothetical protein
MLYWTAYLAEEEIKNRDPGYEYTVAPGCPGKENPPRCTLKEFLL